MSKAMKVFIRIVVTGILFLLLSGNASALAERTLTAGCPSRTDAVVTARWKSGEMTLFLPGCWDLSGITLEMAGEDQLLLGDEMIPVFPGEPADLTAFAGQKIYIRTGKKEGRGTLLIVQGSELPALFLEVDREQLKKVNLSKDKQVTEGRAVYEEADGAVTYDGALTQLKSRGNNTFSYSKKPYQLKLGEKASLSGMGKGKTWILLANWADASLLRNQIVLDLSREIGLRNALNCVQADVWINGAYNGLYLITEKIQIGSGRIDITNLEKATKKVNPEPFDPGKLVQDKKSFPLLRAYPAVADPEDITGGYIFTAEKKARMRNYSLAGFRTENELSIRIKEPTYPSRSQAEYLYARVWEAQKALIAKDGVEPETGKTWQEYLDIESFARKFLIEDFCKNYDYAGGSQYMYKDSDLVDPLIYAGPSWDYDLSFGNMPDRGYQADGAYVTAYHRNLNLYWLLSCHESFCEKVKEVWRQRFRPAAAVLLGETEAAPDSFVRSIDEYQARISASAEMNRLRWGVSTVTKGSGETFDRVIQYLKRWIAERTAWLDKTWAQDVQ